MAGSFENLENILRDWGKIGYKKVLYESLEEERKSRFFSRK